MQMSEYKPKDANNPPVYYQSERYAIEHGEALEYSESMRLNSLCLDAIEKSIGAMNSDESIPGQDVYDPLIQKYGLDRVAFALYGAIGSNMLSDQYSPENKGWAVGLFAMYFFINDGFPPVYQQYRKLNCEPELVDRFVTGFRRTEAKDLEKLVWHHERGEAYTDLCDYFFDKDMPLEKQWKWFWSLKRCSDCTNELDHLSDSVLSEEGVFNGLVSILDEYGPKLTFSVLSNGAFSSPEGSISKGNMEWAFKTGTALRMNEISFLQIGSSGQFEDSDGLNKVLSVAQTIDRSLRNIDDRFEPAYLFGTPVLYSEARLHDYEIPDGFYCYELRGSDYDPGIPVTVEESVRVNFDGSVLSVVAIPIPESGYLRLGEDGILFDDPSISSSAFINTILAVGGDTLEREMGDNIRLENEKLVLQDGPNDLGLLAVNDLYGVYRCNNPGSRCYRKNMDDVQKQGLSVKGKDYGLIYFADMPNEEMSADDIYENLNEGISKNYIHMNDDEKAGRGSSLSNHVGSSDVIVINREGDVKAFYTSVYPSEDPNGGCKDEAKFTELPDFAFERRLLTGYTQTHIIEPTVSVPEEHSR